MTRVIVWVAVLTCSGCAVGGKVPITTMTAPPCSTATAPVRWVGPTAPRDRARLSDWCQSVGAAVVETPALVPLDVSRAGLVVVTWNIHEGYGNLEQLLGSLDRNAAVIVLLQEVARAGDDVPAGYPVTVKAPKRIGPPGAANRDVVAIAKARNMSVAYVPSMRNGAGNSREDRGCAILSNLALSDVAGVELPWVKQRRAAVMATATARTGSTPWRLRVVNVHLDNRPSRSRQSAALGDFLRQLEHDELPIVVGGDLNAWFGTRDGAVRALSRVVPHVQECGGEPTFRFGRRLDHFFTTLPVSARSGCEVRPDRFGSDHHPVLLRLFSTPEAHG